MRSYLISAVNLVQVGRSTAEGLLPWKKPGGKFAKAALSAAGDVIANASDAMIHKKQYTQQQAIMDFGAGYISDLAGG